MLFTDVFSAEAVAYRETVDASNNIAFAGAAFFPNKKKTGIDLKWIKSHKGLGIALKPSSYDSLATIRPRQGFNVTLEEMPLFRESMVIKEQDLAQIMRAADSNDPYLNEVLERIYDDVGNLIDGANISAERMRMQLLAPIDGVMKIDIGKADNTIYSYQYDSDNTWKAKHFAELTGSDTWNNPETAKPLNDVQKGVDYLSGIGVVPTYIMMNTTTFNYLLDMKQIKNTFVTRAGVNVDFLSKAAAKDVFATQTGLQPILYDKMYTDYDGKEKKFYPDGYATIIGAGQLGNTWYGVTPEERTLLGDSNADVSIVDTGVAVAVKTDYGPPVQYSTTASQIVLPSFEGMDSTYVLKVK